MKFVKPLTEAEIATLHDMHRFHPSRRARMRAHCMLLSHQRYTLEDIAHVYQASRRRISLWIDRWHALGLVGLYDQPRSGRPPIYSAQEQQHIAPYLQRYPQRMKRIIEAMANDLHKRVSPQTMRRYIKKTARLETHQKDHGTISRPSQVPTEPTADHAPARPRESWGM